MFGLLLALHVLVCFALVIVILLQSGKGGGLAGGAFGGTAQTVFGGRGATDFLTRATMVLAGAFFVTSVVLSLLSSGTRGPARSLLQEEARRALPSAPAQGGTPPPGSSGAPSTPSGQPSAPSGQPSAPSGGQPSGSGPPPSTPPKGGGP